MSVLGLNAALTFTRAFWGPLRYAHRNLDPAAAKAFERVSAHMQPQCWDEWKGPEFGSESGMTIRWARENVDAWLKKLNPETALLMFGTNDLGQLELPEYEAKTREVVQRCLQAVERPRLVTSGIRGMVSRRK